MASRPILECDLKPLAAAWGIRVPGSEVVSVGEADKLMKTAMRIGYPIMAKLQVDVSARASCGLVAEVATEAELQAWVERVRAESWPDATKVLIEERVGFKDEMYCGVAIDWVRREPVIMFGPGGSDVTRGYAGLTRLPLHAAEVNDFADIPIALRTCARLASTLFTLLHATFIEFNPVAFDERGPMLLDAKAAGSDAVITTFFGDATLIGGSDTDPGFRFRPLRGDIGLVTIGGGTAAVVFDELHRLGRRPANFADLGGGGAFLDRFRGMLLEALKLSPRAMFVGSTPLSAVDSEGLAVVLTSCLSEYSSHHPTAIRIPGLTADHLSGVGGSFIWPPEDATIEGAVRCLVEAL